MKKFKKIVAIEPLLLTLEGKNKLLKLAKESIFFQDVPISEEETVRRIGNADCVLSRFSTKITKNVLDQCPTIKYIGMGCSYYGDNFSNLDMLTAKKHQIYVTYLKDYGDEGVAEGIISQLISLLHGFGNLKYGKRSCELGGLKIGIIGLGTTGILTAQALSHFGSDIYYYSRTRKPEQEEQGITYLPLNKLLETVSILSTHLPRNTIIMGEKEFKLFGNGKIFINTSIGGTYDVQSMKKWLDITGNFHICDSPTKTDDNKNILKHPHTLYVDQSFGETQQCVKRSTYQTLNHLFQFLNN